MRDYGKVYCRFWNSEDMRALTDDGRLLALYLMTCGHGTLAGVFHLPDGYVCWDMQWSSERVAKGFEELLRKGFATRCERSWWVWLTKFLEWNEPENPNQLKAVGKFLTQIPANCSWRVDFQQVFDDLSTTLKKGSRNPSRTVSKPVTVTVSEAVTVTGAVAETVLRSANGCVSGGDEKTKLNGHGPEPDGFIAIRSRYPQRAGDHRWADALTAYGKNLQAGFTDEQMLEGVQRYVLYCTNEGIVGTKYVQAAATFLGDNKAFLQDWPASDRETHGDRWARQGASDAH